MAKKETGYRANIGTPSLILIFMILCLVTFGMLSLTTAKGEWNLAQKNAQYVGEFYRADGEGEVFYQMVFDAVRRAESDSQNRESFKNALSGELGRYYNPEESVIATQIPMQHSQALSIKLILNLDKEDKISISQ